MSGPFKAVIAAREEAKRSLGSLRETVWLLAQRRAADRNDGDQTKDDRAVDAFAVAMKSKMAAARSKGRRGWDDKEDCPTERLSRMLREHVEKGDPVDVANFCMMLHQRDERIPLLSTQESSAALAGDGKEAGR